MDILQIVFISFLSLIVVLLAVILFRQGRGGRAAMDSFRSSLEQRLQSIEGQMHSLSESTRSSLVSISESERKQMSLFFAENRALGDRLSAASRESSEAMKASVEAMRRENLEALGRILKETSLMIDKVREGMDRIREDNDKQLASIRGTVEEKLQKTLDDRITASFAEVTKNLEALYQSIGEMNRLAGDVSSLSRMFSNVKVRGTWGEVQAGTILSDMMTPSQYVANYAPRRGGPVVEFAIRLPGKEEGDDVFLPIDSKFPTEDFIRYSEAVSGGDEDAVASSLKDLRARVISEARDIRDKYIVPPKTTDFAILFVPTESLYAELLRMGGLAETLQETYKVVLTGPTNFSALINSLQLGFRTLQVEKNTKRIWQLFRELKAQFHRFGEDLEKTQEAIDRASDRLGNAVKRNSMISGKLGKIELPDDAASPEEIEASDPAPREPV